MSNTRTLLLALLALFAFMLWNAWQQDYRQPTAPPPPVTGGEVPAIAPPNDVPPPPSGEIPEPPAPALQPAVAASAGEDIVVESDVLRLTIDTVGGTLIGAELLAYPESAGRDAPPFRLLRRDDSDWSIVQSGLLSRSTVLPDHNARFHAAATSFRLASGEDELRVPLRWAGDGVSVEKVFIVRRGDYRIGVEQTVHNDTGGAIDAARYGQLQRTPRTAGNGGGFTNPTAYSYFGAAVYDPAEKFIKLPFDKFREQPFSTAVQGGWMAMIQHYFVAAWLPPAADVFQYRTEEIPGAPVRYLVRNVSEARAIAAHNAATFADSIYLGPKVQDRLAALAPGLELTVDYGMMTVIAKPLFWLLEHIHSVVRNWGLAIIALTLLIKLAFYKLTEAQYRSMARMRKLQPRMEALKERYGDDRQKMSQAMMEMYRTEKVNPLGGCLPILVQIPVFIALYWVLLESVELRQAPFLGWIRDLSARDPYFILPIINGVAMIATQKMTPSPGMDPTQRKIMSALPVVFSVMFAFFPAGLVLYWATNATISLAQQWYITRRIERHG